MRMLANRTIKRLFVQMTFCMAAAVMASALPAAPIYVFAIGGLALYFCYRYFQRQDRQMEEAAARIRAFISGDRDARISCDEEGELYRLFHEINSLAAILNAKAQNEGRARAFLKDTISDISHQLKTPLAALNIYNGIMQAEAEAEGLLAIQEFAGLSERELDRIETLVQNLLKIIKFDTGTMVIEKQAADISEIVAEVESRFAFRAAQEGKQIVTAGSEPLFFRCDRGWIEEALDNLVKNALDHTERGNSVWVTWEKSPSALRIVVRDDGKGIHPEDLHHIFKRFYRSRFSKDTQGIGLGLSLVKAVAEIHGGSAAVESRLGEGASFVLLLPVTGGQV